jgi:hypothetical protein
MVFQIQLAKSLETVPLTRDYIHDFERAHAGKPRKDRILDQASD